MDLASLDTVAASEQGAVMQLRHPTTDKPLFADDGVPITITLAGKDSERCQRAMRLTTNRRLEREARKRQTASFSTVEEIESENLGTVLACTMAWDRIVLGGKSLDLSDENAREFYSRLPWALEQATAFISERSNFLKDSQAS